MLKGRWSSGMIPALGAGGRGFNSRTAPLHFFFCDCKFLSHKSSFTTAGRGFMSVQRLSNGTSHEVIRKNWNDTEKISMAPAQG